MTVSLPTYRHRGARPSDPSKLSRLVDAALHPMLRQCGASQLATESDLRPLWTERLNQGDSESCAAHSFPAALVAACAGAGAPLPFIPSQHLLYSLSGRREQSAGPLQDNGRQLADVADAARFSGLAPMVYDATPDGRRSDIWTPQDGPGATVLLDATDEQLATCAQHELAWGDHLIDMARPDSGDVCVQTLTSAHPAPIWGGFPVGPEFQAYQAGGLVGPEPAGGGHAIDIFGHRTRQNGDREWLLANSYGRDWGDDGFFWASEAFRLTGWELRPMTAVPPTMLERLAAELRSVGLT